MTITEVLENDPFKSRNPENKPLLRVKDIENTTPIGRREEEPICDYDEEPTLLFKQISKRSWEDVAKRCCGHPEEIHTWIVRYKKSKQGNQRKVRWELLPLHAALIFKSPLYIIEMLLERYPDALRRSDDEGMVSVFMLFSIQP